MPRFFFHVFDSDSSRDLEGTVLRSVEEARLEAVHLAGSLLREVAPNEISSDWRMEVTDEQGEVCFLLSFSVFGRRVAAEGADLLSRRGDPYPM